MKNFCPSEPCFQSFFDEYRKNLLEYGEILELVLSLKWAKGLLHYCTQFFSQWFPVSADPANTALMRLQQL